MFDPDKVERWCESGMLEPREFVVRASDYDALLKLYREYRDEAIRNAQGERESQMQP